MTKTPATNKNKALQNNDDDIAAPESDYLYCQISQVKNAGKGLFTAIKIYKEEVIAKFEGEILSPAEAKLREHKGDDKYFIMMIDGSTMDSMNTACFAKYANDAEGLSKSKFKNNATIALDENHKFVTDRKGVNKYSLPSLELISASPQYSSEMYFIAINRATNTIAMVSFDQLVISDTALKEKQVIDLDSYSNRIAISPDGNNIITEGENTTVQLYSRNASQFVKTGSTDF